MWNEGEHANNSPTNTNGEIAKLEGELSTEQAQNCLVRFLEANPFFSVNLLTGFEIYPFQDVIIRSLFEKDFVLFVAGRGLSKCLSVNDLAMTNRGILRMKDVQTGDLIQSKEKTQKVLGKILNPPQKGLKVTTDKGTVFEGLEEHRTLFLDQSDFTLKYKYLSEANEGDFVVGKKTNEGLWGDIGYEKICYDFTALGYGRDFCYISLANEDVCRFLGIMTGDGTFKTKVSVVNKDPEVLDFVDRLTDEMGVDTKKYERNGATHIHINHVKVKQWLSFLGLKEVKSFEKVIPDFIMSNTEEGVCSFLSGLFDCDGYASKQKKTALVGYTSTCYKLLEQVKVLLSNLGIESSINQCFEGGSSEFPTGTHECRPAWSLIICGCSNIEKFSRKIGFSILRKQEVLRKYLENTQDLGKQVLIPDFGYYLKSKKEKYPDLTTFKLGVTEYTKESRHIFNKKRNLSEAFAKFILPYLKDDEKALVGQVLKEDLTFEKIKSIEPVEGLETCDIQVDKEECYVGNGIIHHNSTVAGWYAMLYAIFNPNTRIGICSSNFRQARLLFQNIEKYAYSPRGSYLLQCLIKDKPCKHNPDAWEMHFSNGSVIVAVPLGAGDRIRGYRFNVMIIDELLLLTEKVINEVIQPFMAIQSDPVERQKVREAEDSLIAAGKMTEEDRYKFPSNKLIGLTSASYKFEYLYKLYSDYKELIFDKSATDVSHGILQMSYEIAPEGLYDKKIVRNAKKSSSSAQFAREYMAHFTDDSAGYFSAKRMEDATVPHGHSPSVKLMGNPSKKYVLGIDPNYDDAESSDHFAMCVVELDEETRTSTVVHNYALSKSDIKSRSRYFNYLLNCFNIVYVVFDKAGGKSFFNDLKTLDLVDKKLQIFDHDFDNDNKIEGTLRSKAEYNLNTGKIVHLQYFNPRWIREANESLQAGIERKKVMFGCNKLDESQYQALMNVGSKIPIMDLEYTDSEEIEKKDQKIRLTDFVDRQCELIDLTKRECALIEVTSSATGHQRFDLPQALLRDKSVGRARKDSYSALLLAIYGAKCYMDICNTKEEAKPNSFFTPRFVA